MVFRHAMAPYSDFVLLFHMAIFFIASGYLYNDKSAKDLKSVWKYTLKKIRGLYVPYISFRIVFTFLRNVFINLNIYTDNPEFLNAEGLVPAYVTLTSKYTFVQMLKESAKALVFKGEGQQMGGALWFFQTLLLVLIGYNIAQFIAEKISRKHAFLLQSIVAVLLLMMGYYCHLAGRSFWGLNRVFSVYILIHLGVVFRKYDLKRFFVKYWKCNIAVVVSFLILLAGYGRGYISLVSNDIENPIFLIMMSCAGWVLLFSISKMLADCKFIFNKQIAYLSMHSVSIIGLHFLSFKLVNYIVVLVNGMELYMVAGFPVNIQTGAWWILYTIAGLCIPLLLRVPAVWCRDKVVGVVKSKFA